jgi:hypothetical protein
MMLLATVVLAAQLDACHVLLPKDVAAVQGEAFTEAKLSTRGKKSTSCFYQLPTFSKSVSLDLMRAGGREYWEENFEREREEEKEEAEREGKVKRPPVKVRGVGSEALWVTSRVSGSLYVRKGDAVLRISLGGPGTDEQKIERSKELALKVLKRL